MVMAHLLMCEYSYGRSTSGIKKASLARRPLRWLLGTMVTARDLADAVRESAAAAGSYLSS